MATELGCDLLSWDDEEVCYCVPLTGKDGMERYNPAFLFQLGKRLGPFEGIDANALERLFEQGKVNKATRALARFVEDNTLEFSEGTLTSARGLLEALGDVEPHSETEDDELLGAMAARLAKAFDAFYKRLRDDSAWVNLFHVSSVQAYNTVALLESGERLLPPEYRDKLANYPRALKDMQDGARCFAFGMWTASGFHFARATEAVLQAYWLHVRGARALPPKWGRTWMALVRELDGKQATVKKPEVPPAGDSGLREMLKVVGDGYRNPLVHPEHALTEPDGMILVEGCKALIIRMLDELP